MNNYEHIIEGGLDAMMEAILLKDQCGFCVCDCDEYEGAAYGGCEQGIREWLEAEYFALPTELEEIRDAFYKLAIGGVCEYFGHSINNCTGCPIRAKRGSMSCESFAIFVLTNRLKDYILEQKEK